MCSRISRTQPSCCVVYLTERDREGSVGSGSKEAAYYTSLLRLMPDMFGEWLCKR